MKKYLRQNILILLFSQLILISPALAQPAAVGSFKVQTYYPAPNLDGDQAVVNSLRLRESDLSDEGSCVPGTIKLHNGNLNICGSDGSYDENPTIWDYNPVSGISLNPDFANGPLEIDFSNHAYMLVNSGFYAVGEGATNPGAPPVSGAGERMMWFPANKAFRVGEVTGAQWNVENMGLYSTVLGFDSVASGPHSLATGDTNLATGDHSVNLGGVLNNASGAYSTIINSSGAAASGDNTTIINAEGNVTASGTNVTVIGTPTAAFDANVNDSVVLLNKTAIGMNPVDSNAKLSVAGDIRLERADSGDYAMGSPGLKEEVISIRAVVTLPGLVLAAQGSLTPFSFTRTAPGTYSIIITNPASVPSRCSDLKAVVTPIDDVGDGRWANITFNGPNEIRYVIRNRAVGPIDGTANIMAVCTLSPPPFEADPMMIGFPGP